MIAVRAYVTHCQRGARSNLLLDAEAPVQHRGRVDVGLHVARRNLVPAGGVVPGVICRFETAMLEMDSAVLNGAVWSRR